MPNAIDQVLSASTLIGDGVRNEAGDSLGKIEEIMLDLHTGRVAYAVLSFGGFMGVGNKLFAVPWSAMDLDLENHEFILDMDEERLKDAPGFDKDNWPSSPDRAFINEVYSYYQVEPQYQV
jgi:sporulation protein YlmC with PRC-barrel domain